MTFPILNSVPVPRIAPPNGRPAQQPPFRVLNGAVYFSGKCGECRPFCAAVCCRGYTFVALTDAEAESGKYSYKEGDPACDCDACKGMREAGLRYVLRKRADGACVYLDGTGQCSIYDDRPETCRQYSCEKLAFRVTP